MRNKLSSVLILVLTASMTFAQTSQPAQSSKNSTSQKHTQQSKPDCKDKGDYVNSSGQTVKRPEQCTTAPAGATAQCRDGSYSFSQHRRGTCSHHGGVGHWLAN